MQPNTPNTREENLLRIKKALRKGAIDRNAKTALALGLAMSGAIISLPVLAATTSTTLMGLYLLKCRKKTLTKKQNNLSLYEGDDF